MKVLASNKEITVNKKKQKKRKTKNPKNIEKLWLYAKIKKRINNFTVI